MEVKIELGLSCTYDLSEILPAQFVAVLKLTIVVGLLLYGIIG